MRAPVGKRCEEQTKPLRKRSRAAKPQLRGSGNAGPPRKLQRAAEGSSARQSVTWRPDRTWAADSAGRLAPLGRRERLRNFHVGRKESMPGSTMHGMTQTPRHIAPLSSGFFATAHSDGLTFVLIITGKGRTIGPESERGVLRPPSAAMAEPAGIPLAGGRL